MKYVSIDLETTGLDPERDRVLSAAFVVEDTAADPLPAIEDLPTFQCYVRHERYSGSAYALALNADLLKVLAGKEAFVDCEPYNGGLDKRFSRFAVYEPHESWEKDAAGFLCICFGNDKIVAAGKNVAGFDLRFFPYELKTLFHHRTIDPGSVYLDWSAKEPFGLQKLKDNLGIKGKVAHTALEDARDVIRVLRKSYARAKT